MPIVDNQRLLEANAAAHYLSISRSKLYQWAKKGKITSVRIDGSIRWDVFDLDVLIEKLKAEQKG